jgi:F-type H+-transporting ATPase subunit delta
MKSTKQIRREAGQLFRLCLVNRRLDENRVQQVVHRVVEAKRRGYLALLSRFQRLVKLEMARHRAEVESATPLPADLQSTVLAGLERVYGSGISSSFVHRPVLIGGIRIKVASDVYDGSVKAGLAALEKSF